MGATKHNKTVKIRCCICGKTIHVAVGSACEREYLCPRHIQDIPPRSGK